MEFVRHRVFSFAQESTRYCNYSKDKFGNELTFIIPCWAHLNEGWYGYQISEKNITSEIPTIDEGYLYSVKPILTEENADKAKYIQDETAQFISSLTQSEVDYFRLLNNGWTPQQAIAVLPNALKTELIITGFISDWKHFFKLRATEAGAVGPHPQASELANPLYKEFLKRKYI